MNEGGRKNLFIFILLMLVFVLCASFSYLLNSKVRILDSNNLMASVTNIKLNKNMVKLNYKDSAQLKVEEFPENVSNKKVVWKSSNPKLVTVDETGKITVVSDEEGSAIITATTIDDAYKASTKVVVTEADKEIKVNGLKLNKTKLALSYGHSYKLQATVLPENATDKTVLWSSSNPKLAIVDKNGKVTLKKGISGIVYITATTKDGNYEKSVKLRVMPNGVPIKFKSTYSKYKTNIYLKRSYAAMQSFAIYDNYIYITQQQGSRDGSSLSKVDMRSVRNNSNEGDKFLDSVSLKDFGHVANIDIEKTNNKAFLWIGCSRDDSKEKYVCRINLDSIKYTNPPKLQTASSLSALRIRGAAGVAVDSKNRILVTRTGSRRYHKFTVYNLDDYIEYAKKHGEVDSKTDKEAKNIEMFSFIIDQGNYDFHRQGFTVYGKYIYSYEGDKNGAYLSVYKINGKKMVYREKIGFPSNVYNWEPEGIKVYNGEIYIGYVKQDKNTKLKSQYIYKLGKN